MNWDFYSKRRKVTLQTFLLGIHTLQDAKEKFNKFRILPPEDDVINSALTENKPQEDLSSDNAQSDLDDIEYVRKNLFDSLKIPEKYLSSSDLEQVPIQKKQKQKK